MQWQAYSVFAGHSIAVAVDAALKKIKSIHKRVTDRFQKSTRV